MNPVAIIKKNAGWYLVRIIVTGLAAFVGIILSKRILPPNEFLDFNLLANGVTLLNSFLIAWFGQSIIRFYHSYHYFFRVKNIVLIITANFLFVGMPVFFVWKAFIGIDRPVLYPLVFMMLNALYTALLLLFQAAHKARIVAAAETMRSAVIIAALFVPQVVHAKVDVDYFWLVWVASCLLTSIYLFMVRKTIMQSFFLQEGQEASLVLEKTRVIISRVAKFGLPLSAWVFVSFLLLNADRWFVYKSGISTEAAANYVALSDLMMRGTGFLFSPIVSSAYPVISSLYDEGRKVEVRGIVLKVILWQTLLAIAAAAGFIVVNKMLFRMLGTNQDSYLLIVSGLVMIAGNTLWQVSAMFHKVAELGVETIKLFWALCVSCAVVYACYYYFIKPDSLMGVIAVMSIGYILYFLYTYWLFATYKWNEHNEKI